MFEARLLQGKVLKQIIDAIKDLVSDANLETSDEGVSLQSMDSSHVALVDVMLMSSGFDHFRCDRPSSLGFNSENMAKIIKIAGGDDAITLKAEDEASTLELLFESPGQQRIADFEVGLMDVDTEQLGIPDIEYKCTIKMPSAEFQRIVRDMQVMGDAVTVACTKEGISFEVTGDLGTGKVLTRANPTAEKESEQVVIDMEEPVELSFALRYLSHFTKATPLSDSVIISMSPDVPMVVEYPIAEVGHVKYYLAPKIEENE